MKANHRFSLSAKFAAVAAALALAGSAVAATDAAAPAQDAKPAAVSAQAGKAGGHEGGHHWRGHHHKHGPKLMRDAGMWVPGYGPLSKTFVASLSLTDAQNKLIDEARTAQDEARKARFEQMKEKRGEHAEQIKAGKIDPKAALAAREKARNQADSERAKIDDKWLAVWDALDTAQQEKVGQHFAERAEKFAKRAQERKERHAQHKQQKQDAAKPVAS